MLLSKISRCNFKFFHLKKKRHKNLKLYMHEGGEGGGVVHYKVIQVKE